MPEFVLDYGTDDAARAFKALDSFTQGYVTAMFFTDTGDAENGDLESASFAELAPTTLEKIISDCACFQLDNGTAMESAYAAVDGVSGWNIDDEKAGRDFWYNRNGHGCGFWDGDWPEPFATALDKAAKQFGQIDLYRGDDGKIYVA